MMGTIKEAKQFLIHAFKAAGLESADIDARLLLMHVTGLSHVDLISSASHILSDETADEIKSLSMRRISGEPVDHILGYKEFYGRRFKVTKDVLSPRPETEMLVDEALRIIGTHAQSRVLDLGTGSGAIIISILAESNLMAGTATDISEAALRIARENAQTHDVYERLKFIQGSWLDFIDAEYDLIISNPPYISHADILTLQEEVKGFDPDLALSGGGDGLEAYRAIISNVTARLSTSGKVLFEIGFDQAAAVSNLLKQAGLTNISVRKDLAQHDRVVMAEKPN